MSVGFNKIVFNSALLRGDDLHLLPASFSGVGKDSDPIDPSPVGCFWDETISDITIEGKYPHPIAMSANCAKYKGRVQVYVSSTLGLQFYCDQVTVEGNSHYCQVNTSTFKEKTV